MYPLSRIVKGGWMGGNPPLEKQRMGGSTRFKKYMRGGIPETPLLKCGMYAILHGFL